MHLRSKILAFAALPLLALAAGSYLLDRKLADGLVRADAERSARAWMWRVRIALGARLERDASELERSSEVSEDMAWVLGSDILAEFDADNQLLDCFLSRSDSLGRRSLPASWLLPMTAASRWVEALSAGAVMRGYLELDGKVLGLVVGPRRPSGHVTMIGRWLDREALGVIPVAEDVRVEVLPRGVALPSPEDQGVHVRDDELQLLLDRREPERVSVYAPLCDPSGMVGGYVRVEFPHRVAAIVPEIMCANLLVLAALWVIAVSVALWFVHAFGIRRLVSMTDAVSRILTDQKGHCLVPILRDDEIGKLGDAVNTFVKRLRIDALEVERLARAKTDFLATMSHEIRTPLTALSGYADMLMDDSVCSREREEAVDTIHRNGFHLLAVLNEILDLTHVEDGEPAIALQVCEPREIVLSIQELSRMRASARHLSLDLDVHLDVPMWVECDPMRVRQVLLNLVGNALKFTENGGVTIVVRTDQSGDHARLLFDVVDTGVGMSTDELERVFAPFQQADSSTQRRFGGTGLGLNISQRIAKMHGGSLMVESRPGQGTRFTFAIALSAVESDEGLLVGGAFPESEEGEDSKLSILLCESVLETRMLLASQIQSAGMDVAVASDALSACQGALRSRHEYDVIILDMQSPESDACVMAQLLRQAAFGGSVLALTASPSVEERARCLASGCDDYLFKPFLQVEFVSVIRRLGRGRH